MDKEIYLLGLNHRTAGVDVRERFALTDFCCPECWAVPCGQNVSETVILSTCNRVEVLACGTDETPDYVLHHWATAKGRTAGELAPYVYTHTGTEAIRHLFTVASSLDSMVLGEPQILGQLKDAYRKAVSSNSTGVILNRLLHKAFSVAKRVRTETGVASSAVSISYAAVELAKRIFGDMHNHSALLVGAGEMAELAAAHLLQAGIKRILVANRTLARGQELAQQMGGEAIPFEQLFERLIDVDIIITSTGSPEAIIHAKDIREVLRRRKQRPMFFIDIAVPRDIDPDVNGLDNVYLYDIDDLKEVVEENLANRRDEAVKATNIVAEEVQTFAQWIKSLDSQPTILDLIQRGEHIAQEEVARTLKHLGQAGLTDNAATEATLREALEHMAASLVRKMNHDPIAFIRRGTMSEEGTTPRISIARRIFNLDGLHTTRRKG